MAGLRLQGVSSISPVNGPRDVVMLSRYICFTLVDTVPYPTPEGNRQPCHELAMFTE